MTTGPFAVRASSERLYCGPRSIPSFILNENQMFLPYSYSLLKRAAPWPTKSAAPVQAMQVGTKWLSMHIPSASYCLIGMGCVDKAPDSSSITTKLAIVVEVPKSMPMKLFSFNRALIFSFLDASLPSNSSGTPAGAACLAGVDVGGTGAGPGLSDCGGLAGGGGLPAGGGAAIRCRMFLLAASTCPSASGSLPRRLR